MVPVLDRDKKPLMPCSEKRAKKLMESGRAKPYWFKGIFCIILQDNPKSRFMQDIVIGIDPGSKFNGYTVKSEAHTLLNLQIDAISSVKSKIDERWALRRCRRQRGTPYRKCRRNKKSVSRIPPSSKARWQQHLNIIKWSIKIFNITDVIIEDVKAISKKNAKKWNSNFSPIQIGKKYLFQGIKDLGLRLHTKSGWETYTYRLELGLKKNSKKDRKDFYTHCVDSWVLANEYIGGHTKVDNTKTLFLRPIMFHRRKLHMTTPKANNFRRRYGGTISLGIKRGTLVKHHKYGLCLVGGTSKNKISVHSLETNKRLCAKVDKEHLKILTNFKWNICKTEAK